MFWLVFVFVSIVSAGSYEMQKAANTGQHDSGLTYTVQNRYDVDGYLATIPNPIGHFHVYFPQLQNSSCGGRENTSVQARNHKCIFATNGSPFSFDPPTCMGSLVSDGVIYSTEELPNGYFGLTKGGYFVIGTLNKSDILSLQFDQLIMGFDWLVRKGEITVNSGGQIAPRTIIGTNEDGQLLILQVDGIESGDQGLTLYQAAEWAQAVGGYNVLNLDGGGSSATVYNGEIIDHPTCLDTPQPICERAVTTITCII